MDFGQAVGLTEAVSIGWMDDRISIKDCAKWPCRSGGIGNARSPEKDIA